MHERIANFFFSLKVIEENYSLLFGHELREGDLLHLFSLFHAI